MLDYRALALPPTEQRGHFRSVCSILNYNPVLKGVYAAKGVNDLLMSVC